MQVHNERSFPQDNRDSEINARFLLNEHGNLIFLFHNNSVHIILLNFKKIKNLTDGKKDIGERVQKTITLCANYDRENDSTNADHVVLNSVTFPQIL